MMFLLWAFYSLQATACSALHQNLHKVASTHLLHNLENTEWKTAQKSRSLIPSIDLSECPDSCVCIQVRRNKLFLDCSAVGSTKIPNALPTNLGMKVIELHLDKNQIERLPANSFEQFPRIRSLSISKNRINSIDIAAFHGLQCLEHLMLMTNLIDDIQDRVFAPVGKSLLLLNLYGAGMNSINPESFYNLTHLVDLDLSLNLFEALPANSFWHLKALRRLNITWTRLSTINQLAFVGLNNLERLDLTESHLLQSLPDLVFSYMPSLQYLNLTGSRINPINSTAFVNISVKLKEFYIECNHFPSLPANFSLYLWMLQNLSLSCNRLGAPELDANSFTGFKNLKTLELHDNAIANLPIYIFRPLIFLELLDLSLNKLETLDSRWFANLNKLRVLNLSYNSLDDPSILTMTSETFLPSLKILRLDSNWISSVNISSLKNLHSLLELDLSHNQISILCSKHGGYWKEFSDNSVAFNMTTTKFLNFTGRNKYYTTSRIKVLDLSVNSLRDIGIDENCLSELPNLQELYLTSNQIEVLSDVTFQGLHSLAVLDLSGNPISTFVDGTFSNLPISSLYLSHIGAHTLNSEAFMNLTALIYLDLSYNKFQSIPNLLDKNNNSVVPHLSNLELVSNPIKVINLSDSNNCNGLKNLRKLNLDIIPIQNLGIDTFASLNNLKFLSFAGNRLHSIDSYTFRSQSLQQLQLIDSSLPSSSFNYLDGLPNLDSLDLSNCNFLSQESRVEHFNISKLRTLNLSDTSISLDEHSLKAAVMLETFILTKNSQKFIFLNSKIFMPLKNLKNLHLKNIGIETINATSLPFSFWTRLSEVDLSYNPYRCDCDIVWFRKWLKSPRMKIIGIDDPSAYICASPNAYKDVPIRQLTRDFDFNCFLELKNNGVVWNVLIILIVFVVVSCIGAIFYHYRCYIRYMMFFVRSRVHDRQDHCEENEYTYDAFVMYSRQDQNWVLHQLLPNLETREDNISLCIHERNWLGGRWIQDNIIESIEDSRKCLLIVSNAFADSHWCHCEMSLAQASRIRRNKNNIVLVLLEEIADINMTPKLRFQMENYTYIEWTNSDSGEQLFWIRLREAIKRPMQHVSTSPPTRDMIAASN